MFLSIPKLFVVNFKLQQTTPLNSSNCNITARVQYVHADDKRPCCISGAKFHQMCHCPGVPLSYCKTQCDDDKDCKGYVAWSFEHPEGDCQLATTSTCPSPCFVSKDTIGNVGPLLVGEECGYDNWGGCYIKSKGRSTNLTLVW